MKARIREQQHDTGAVRLNYAESTPNGPAFVLLHGGSSSWQYGVELIRALSECWHVFAPDLRGHGKSGHVPGSYTLPDYAADIAIFLRDVVQEPATVFGHSLGGQIALALAAKYPDHVKAAIIGDALLVLEERRDEDKIHQQMVTLWYDLVGQPVEDVEAALRNMPVTVPGQLASMHAEEALGADNPWFSFQALNLNRLDPGTLAVVLEGPGALLAGESPEQLLQEIACPVLLLQADSSLGSSMDARDVEQTLKTLKNAEYVRLAGIGHELHGPPGQAVQVLDAIMPFLRSIYESS